MQLDELRTMVSDGKIFGVRFIKRTDGSMRTMAARTGVKPKQDSLEQRHWDPADKGLLQVWDVHKRGFRFIPADAVREVRVRGQRIVPDLATGRPPR